MIAYTANSSLFNYSNLTPTGGKANYTRFKIFQNYHRKTESEYTEFYDYIIRALLAIVLPSHG